MTYSWNVISMCAKVCYEILIHLLVTKEPQPYQFPPHDHQGDVH
jgi:hypothetical protein